MVEIQNKIAILVDFDNWYPNVLKSEDETKILNLLNNVINQIIPDSEEFEYISIGMYGGWYTGNVLTQKASVLSSMLPRLQNIFPFRKTNSQVLIQGEIKLATQLYDDETSIVQYIFYKISQRIKVVCVELTHAIQSIVRFSLQENKNM